MQLRVWLPSIFDGSYFKIRLIQRERERERERERRGVFGFVGSVLFCSSCFGVQIKNRIQKERRKEKFWFGWVWVEQSGSQLLERAIEARREKGEGLINVAFGGFTKEVESNGILGTGIRRKRKI